MKNFPIIATLLVVTLVVAGLFMNTYESDEVRLIKSFNPEDLVLNKRIITYVYDAIKEGQENLTLIKHYMS